LLVFLRVLEQRQFDTVKAVFDFWFLLVWRFRKSSIIQFILSRMKMMDSNFVLKVDGASVDRRCPVCGSSSREVANYSRDQVISSIEHVLDKSGLHTIPFDSAKMLRCNGCALDFANPMREPSVAFYKWLAGAGFYYPKSRWEWDVCFEILSKKSKGSFRNCQLVVDIGCGEGAFLLHLASIKDVKAIGFDLNPNLASLENARGLDIRIGDTSTACSEFPQLADMVTLWHVVEHVADPVGVLLDAKKVLNPGGLILFSVPLSPMSYEYSWKDPFNGPPHHLTRWTLSSLKALASRIGMHIELMLPVAAPFHSRLIRSLALQATSPFSVESRTLKLWRLILFVLANPWRVPQEAWTQLTLPRINGCVKPDVALVSLCNRDVNGGTPNMEAFKLSDIRPEA
jgi:2-polyprenyl-3-methyl-5-hydroxy-6-metoxy-1,4-benzoquinol methylase